MSKGLEWIATREFVNTRTNQTVTLKIGKPYPTNEYIHETWICQFQILGGGDDSIYPASGGDSFQSLCEALKGSRLHLKSLVSESELFLDGSNSWLGLYILLNDYGSDFQDRLNDFVAPFEINLLKIFGQEFKESLKLEPQIPENLVICPTEEDETHNS
jgi:hypothetical protein